MAVSAVDWSSPCAWASTRRVARVAAAQTSTRCIAAVAAPRSCAALPCVRSRKPPNQAAGAAPKAARTSQRSAPPITAPTATATVSPFARGGRVVRSTRGSATVATWVRSDRSAAVTMTLAPLHDGAPPSAPDGDALALGVPPSLQSRSI